MAASASECEASAAIAGGAVTTAAPTLATATANPDATATQTVRVLSLGIPKCSARGRPVAAVTSDITPGGEVQGSLGLFLAGVYDHDRPTGHPQQLVGDAPEHHVGHFATTPVADHDQGGVDALGQAGQVCSDRPGPCSSWIRSSTATPRALAARAAWPRTGSAASSLSCDGPFFGSSSNNSSAKGEKWTKITRAPVLAARSTPTSVARAAAGVPSTPITIVVTNCQG